MTQKTQTLQDIPRLREFLNSLAEDHLFMLRTIGRAARWALPIHIWFSIRISAELGDLSEEETEAAFGVHLIKNIPKETLEEVYAQQRVEELVKNADVERLSDTLIARGYIHPTHEQIVQGMFDLGLRHAFCCNGTNPECPTQKALDALWAAQDATSVIHE